MTDEERIASRERQREYYKNNRDKEIARVKRYREEHPDKIRQTQKKTHDKTRESRNAYSREYYQNNKDKVIELTVNWQQRNKERFYETMRRWRRNNRDKMRDFERIRRARKRTQIIETVRSREIYERDQWICQLCHKKVNKRLKYPHPLSASLDHITPLSLGGTHERRNVQLAHLRCNVLARDGGEKQLLLFG
jgi:hypothetical protein